MVDLTRRHCFPVYWNGENRRVLRGHWFARKGGLDWLPLREDVAEQLEIAYRSQVWHRRTFQPSGLFAVRVDLQGSTPGLYALFTGEDDTWEAWLNVDASGFSSFVNLSGNGIKVRLILPRK
ncbi:Phospholipase sgr2 [Orobanche gracilis]